MKKLFIFMMLNLLLTSVYSQLPEDKVPQPVRAAFQKKFPKVNSITWKEEGKSVYVAYFLNSGSASRELFSKDGKWLEAYKTIPAKALPEPVISTIGKLYKEDSILSAERVSLAGYGLCYDAVIGNSEHKKTIRFSKTGEVMKK